MTTRLFAESGLKENVFSDALPRGKDVAESAPGSMSTTKRKPLGVRNGNAPAPTPTPSKPTPLADQRRALGDIRCVPTSPTPMAPRTKNE